MHSGQSPTEFGKGIQWFYERQTSELGKCKQMARYHDTCSNRYHESWFMISYSIRYHTRYSTRYHTKYIAPDIARDKVPDITLDYTRCIGYTRYLVPAIINDIVPSLLL